MNSIGGVLFLLFPRLASVLSFFRVCKGDHTESRASYIIIRLAVTMLLYAEIWPKEELVGV